MHYRLRTLLLLLAIGPPVLATIGPPLWRWLRPDPTEQLIELILSTRAPASWDDVGGPGSIQGFDASFILIVSEEETEAEKILEVRR